MTVASSVLAIVLNPVSAVAYGSAVVIVLLVLYVVQNEITRYRSRIKNLPGPRGWPVAGNLFQVRAFFVGYLDI